MQKIRPFLWFDDNAEEAMNFYLSAFPSSKLVSSNRWGDGGPLPKGTLMSATLELAGSTLMLLNAGPHYAGFTPAISLYVSCNTQAEVDALWNKLCEGGTPEPCGWLKDKYGLSWQIIPDTLIRLMNDEDKAKAGRVIQAMLKMKKIEIAALEQAHAG